ncbi:hypothetical protein ACHAPU_006883 [Fusarium lateritium]
MCLCFTTKQEAQYKKSREQKNKDMYAVPYAWTSPGPQPVQVETLPYYKHDFQKTKRKSRHWL